MKAAEHSMAFMRYGPRWRTHRKLFNDFINLSTVDRYDVNQVKAVSNFLVNLLRNPEALREHINLYISFHLISVLACSPYDVKPRLTGSLALSIAYGIQADAPDNEFFCMYKLLLGAMNQVFVPGSFAVDILPFRGSYHLSTSVRRRALTDGDLPQSSICLLGFQASNSTHMQTRLTRTCVRL